MADERRRYPPGSAPSRQRELGPFFGEFDG
jgi:hypothetical protein